MKISIGIDRQTNNADMIRLSFGVPKAGMKGLRGRLGSIWTLYCTTGAFRMRGPDPILARS
jgi:hypothetical protein